MNGKFVTVLLACFLLFASSASAGSADKSAEYQASQLRYLQAAKEYQARGKELSRHAAGLASPQKGYVKQLSEVYGELAGIKVELADAIGKRDWGREERLEKRYYRLKDREKALWDTLEASKK